MKAIKTLGSVSFNNKIKENIIKYLSTMRMNILMHGDAIYRVS